MQQKIKMQQMFKRQKKHLLVILAINVSALNYVKLLCQHLEERGREFSSKQHQ